MPKWLIGVVAAGVMLSACDDESREVSAPRPAGEERAVDVTMDQARDLPEAFEERGLDDEPIEEEEPEDVVAEVLASCKELWASLQSVEPGMADELAAERGATALSDRITWAFVIGAVARGEVESREDKFILLRALALTYHREADLPSTFQKDRARALVVAAERVEQDPDLGLLFVVAFSDEDSLWSGIKGIEQDKLTSVRTCVARQLRDRIGVEIVFRDDIARPICEAVATSVDERQRVGRLLASNVVASSLVPEKRRDGSLRIAFGDPPAEVKRVIRATGEDLLIGIRRQMVSKGLFGL
ncbi:MAG: hypothetical protein R3F20_13960 [Planctomycetota bacterium]